MRPAYLFAEAAAKYDSQIEIAKEDMRVDGKSVLSILTLGATQGSELQVMATGSDAQQAVEELAGLILSGFPGQEADGLDSDPVDSNPINAD